MWSIPPSSSIFRQKDGYLDSVWLAEIALNGMFKASYIPPRDVREFRELTRTHRKLVEERTAHKNRIHKILERSGIRLSGVLSDIFGKSGLLVITGLIEGCQRRNEFPQSRRNKVPQSRRNKVPQAGSS